MLLTHRQMPHEAVATRCIMCILKTVMKFCAAKQTNTKQNYFMVDFVKKASKDKPY